MPAVALYFKFRQEAKRMAKIAPAVILTDFKMSAL